MNGKSITHMVYWVLIGIILSSCGGRATPLALPSPTQLPATVPTLTPSPTLAPISTPTMTLSTGLITFDSKRNNLGWGIYSMNADEPDDALLLTISPNNGDEYSTWSADGTKIAFHSYRSGRGDADIYMINSDGTGLVRLTDSPAREIKPAWSPDGAQIAFLSSSDSSSEYELSLINIDGSGLEQIANGVDRHGAPSWSPDGNRIAFTSQRDGKLEIYVINKDGGEQIQLTKNSGSFEPDWSPNGQRITFASIRDGNEEIYVMDVDGDNVKRLTSNKSSDFEPVWSPDGNYVAFSSNRDGNFNIYLMKSNGNDVSRLTDDPADDFTPRWSPEGVTMSDKPWIGPPYCLRDANADNQPDTATSTFNSSDKFIYIEFPYRNMQDGTLFSHKWINTNSKTSPKIMKPWNGGESGFHTSYFNASDFGTGTWTIQLFIDEQLLQEIECTVVEP